MNKLIIKEKNPLASITEESLCLDDFVQEVCYQEKATGVKHWVNTQEAAIGELDYDLSIVCLEDNLSPAILCRISNNLKGKVILYEPTIVYGFNDPELEECILELLTRENIYLVTNNLDLFYLSKDDLQSNIIYTNSISNHWLNQENATEESYDLAILDLLQDQNLLTSNICSKYITPFLNAERSRTVEKLIPIRILTNLGVSSLRTSPESLEKNGIIIEGISWSKSNPENYFVKESNCYYPGNKAKAFGRWAYLAEQHGMKLYADTNHGYKSFSGQMLDDIDLGFSNED